MDVHRCALNSMESLLGPYYQILKNYRTALIVRGIICCNRLQLLLVIHYLLPFTYYLLPASYYLSTYLPSTTYHSAIYIVHLVPFHIDPPVFAVYCL